MRGVREMNACRKTGLGRDRLEWNNRIGQPAGLTHNRHAAVSKAVELAQPARFVS